MAGANSWEFVLSRHQPILKHQGFWRYKWRCAKSLWVEASSRNPGFECIGAQLKKGSNGEVFQRKSSLWCVNSSVFYQPTG